MSAGTALGVHDDFTTGYTGVSMRAANHEIPGRVHMEAGAWLVDVTEVEAIEELRRDDLA